MEHGKTPWKTARRFWSRQDGNITIFSVFMTLLVLLVTGAAVDIMRYESTRALMQTNMDRAVLAAIVGFGFDGRIETTQPRHRRG